MLFEPFPKIPCYFTYALLLAIHLVEHEPIDYTTFLSDHVPIFEGPQEVADCVASFEMYLETILSTYILVFAKPLGEWDHYVDIPVCVVTTICCGFIGSDSYYIYSCCKSNICLIPKGGTCISVDLSCCILPLP